MISELAVMNRVAGVTKTYVDDVFSAYTYTGNGSTQTITNGIDLAGKGGLVWTKSRSAAEWHILSDSVTNVGLYSNATNASGVSYISAFNANGYAITGNSQANGSGNTQVSWSFRKAPKFFDVVTYTGNGVASRQIPHALGIAPGMVIVKQTDGVRSWPVYHRSVPTGTGYLNTTSAFATGTGNGVWGDSLYNNIAPTDSVFYVGTDSDVNGNGLSYVAYLFAHDTDTTNGIIQCGAFTTDGSGNATVTLGWEPQFVLSKSTGIDNWEMLDTMRGWNNTTTMDMVLRSNSNIAEFGDNRGNPTATGFTVAGIGASETRTYLAIRRPNKPPTVGTQVYNAIARTGTGAAATVTGVGFTPDLLITNTRSSPGQDHGVFDRLRGSKTFLRSSHTGAEVSDVQSVTSLDMDGVSLGTDATGWLICNINTYTYINHFFRRAPGFFDEVCYTGTGANKTETHNLTKAPELWLMKGRGGATEWVFGSNLIANTEKIVMPSPNGVVTDATAWNSTYPTSTAFSLGTAAAVNTNAATYVASLWATLAGISKVGTYTGNGSNQTINCGFSTGARFVLIIRTTASTAQNIFIWDTVRGIVAGNDPRISLNTTAAEVTTDDSIDADTSGFIVNQDAATNINVNSAVYLFLAIA